MDLRSLADEIGLFNQQTHGSSNYYEDLYFVQSPQEDFFAPLGHLKKKMTDLEGVRDLLGLGFVCESLDLLGPEGFAQWYEKQFSRKLKRSQARKSFIVSFPQAREILQAIEAVDKNYEILKKFSVIMNGKNLPVQLGEWYAKCIFGLHQVKSTSQRGFDFYLQDKRTEVKVHWSDSVSHKGVKLRKSLVELSDFVILMYLASNFMIREVCFLDADFVIRKFAGKGPSVFLKEGEIGEYFFGRSSKHAPKVANATALLKFSTPNFALKLSEVFS